MVSGASLLQAGRMRAWLLRLSCRLTDHFRYRGGSYQHLEWRGESHHERTHGWEIVDIIKCLRCSRTLYLPRPEKRTVWRSRPAVWLLPRKEHSRAAWVGWIDRQWWWLLMWDIRRPIYRALMAAKLYRLREGGGYYNEGRFTPPWSAR